MKKREKSDPFVLASTALFLFLIIFSSTALAANNGNALAFQGSYEEVIKACDKAIKINSQNSEAWYNKGTALTFQGNYTEAIKAFDKVVEIDPQNLAAWYNKGICFMILGNCTEAIKAFDKIVEIDPQNLAAWNNKGICFAKLGNYKEAIKAYDKAIQINPQSSEAWYNKGLSLKCLDNYEEAIKAFDKAVEFNSQDVDAWYNKGRSLECLGNYEEAIKAFDKVIKIDPQDSGAWYNKGICFAHLGNNKAAVEALDKAIEIAPQKSEALTLKESILSNSNGLMMSLKSLFSNNDIFVEEDDLLEYAQTYLKTYGDSINDSNLTQEERRHFSFIQGYPYSASASISNIHGASITFIPHSTDENKVTRVSYSIEKLIPKITEKEINNSVMVMQINNNISDFSIDGFTIEGGYIYLNNSTNNCLFQCNYPIILGKKACINGLTYIESNKLFREEEFAINGTLVLNDSKVIMKSNLKKDWTKEKAEEDAIGFIYKEQIDRIFNYSKLTGIGYREIDKLVTDYKEKETTGYYETNSYARLRDVHVIFSKADQYGIPHDVVSVQLLYNKQEEKPYEKALRYVDSLLTVRELAVIIIGTIGLIKRKELHQKFIELRHKFIEIVSWIKKKIYVKN